MSVVSKTLRTAWVLGAVCVAATAFAQGAAPSKSGARKGYKSAAQHEAAAARGSRLDQQNEEAYLRNALARCERLPGGYKQACEDRVRGAGTRTGSVEGGGIVRESEIRADLLPAAGAATMTPAEASVPAPARAPRTRGAAPAPVPAQEATEAGAPLMHVTPPAAPKQ